MSITLEEAPVESHITAGSAATGKAIGHKVTAIEIQNYKSVRELTLDLARFTVLIGENGCGKSNILEAIALGGAAAGYKLDHEFLASRGIRVTDPPLMRSAFDASTINEDVRLRFNCDTGMAVSYNLANDNEPYSQWFLTSSVEHVPSAVVVRLDKTFARLLKQETANGLRSLVEESDLSPEKQQQLITTLNLQIALEQDVRQFLVYSPENSALRTFESEGQIQPLGVRGEGLFKLLSVFAGEQDQPGLKKLNDLLKLVDWFKEFAVPDKLVAGRQSISIQDRFLKSRLERLDQRSANEGFLFLLFYFSLFISAKTPPFFAIDNVDSSLNPKLCAELIRIFVRLCKEHNKRVIVTTHNPAILDGLDLEDPEQRLLVVYRNGKGHTVANRVRPLRPLPGQEPVRLSEAFIRGYLGGLPRNF